MGRLRELGVDSAKESGLFTLIALPVAYPLLVYFQTTFVDSFGFALLIEACVLMLIGGAVEFGAPAASGITALLGRRSELQSGDRERRSRKAEVYTLTGVILFAEAVVVALTLALG